MKRKIYSRVLSFILALSLVLGNQSIQGVLAAENEVYQEENTESISGENLLSEADSDKADETEPEADSDKADETEPEADSDKADETEPEADSDKADEAEPEADSDKADETESEVTESEEAESEVTESEETDMEEEPLEDGEILRIPEKFYEDPEPENYGTLVAYDELSRTYYVEDNNYVTVIGYDGNSYIDYDGSLEKVDNTLMEAPKQAAMSMSESEDDAAVSYVNCANSFMVNIESDMKEGEELYYIANGESFISIAPLGGEFHQGIAEDNAIRYSNVYENVDFQYTIIGNAVKEDIILLDRQELHTFSFKIDTYGLKSKVENNSLFLYEEGADPATESVFVLEAPEMEDAAGNISFGVKLESKEVEDGCIVTVTADKEWLDSSDRTYPVRIDPTAIQINGNSVHVACAEQGSPNRVIGDNQYPYVGFDDGITSGNLAGFGSKHLNCRSYFQIDYDFSTLANEMEIVSATFMATQKTRWSKGTSEFGIYGVEEDWKVTSLTWNNQLDFNHYFLDSQTASTQKGQVLSFDVTEEVSGWINGTSANHGFVMKALIEAPDEASFANGVGMQSEVFYNNASAAYGPKLVISWIGELTELDRLTLDDTTIDVYPVVERNGDKSTNTLGVVAHGLAKPGSTVTYCLVNGTTGEVEAEKELVYPDSSAYQDQFPSALEYKRRLSNWQSEVFSNLVPGQVYTITATASENGQNGVTVESDRFLIYEESAFDVLPRIANHYGVEVGTILSDMKMQDCLTKTGNRIFIREPQNTGAYSSGELSDYYKAMLDGLLLGRAQNCMFGFEPINLNTGNFYMEQEDAGITDIGGDFSITRQYNAKGAGYKGSLGYGWNFAYDERLGELEDGSVIWQNSNGTILTFSKSGASYEAPAGQDYVLEENENGYIVTELETGNQHVFDSYGLLVSLADIYGNHTDLDYDMDYHLRRITSPSGKTFGITLDGEERIHTITLPDGGTVSYQYDASGNLISVTDAAGDSVTYSYDSSHRMTAWYDENKNRVVENTYDDQDRVTSQTDALGSVIHLEYKENQTTATDAQGNVTIYHYDDRYRTTMVEYPDGTTEKYSYNNAGYADSHTDRSGLVMTYTYDGNGNVLTQTRQDGSVRKYTYNTVNQITSATEYDGGKMVYGYDDAHRLVTVTDAEGGKTVYGYDDKNRMTSITDARGNKTVFTYQGACVESMTDAMGSVWYYSYDAMNRLLSTTDPNGSVSKSAYDAKGRRVSETDGAGNTTYYTFDAAGVVTAITDKEGQTSTFTYDKANQMLSGKDPLGNTLSYTYDKNGNVVTETDAEGQTISYTYDSMNRVSAMTDAMGNVCTYSYDADNHIVAVTDRRGNTSETIYDSVTKAVAVETDKAEHVTKYETDVMGRITKVINPDQSTISYTWDKNGRIVSSTDELGTTTVITYDQNGNAVSVKDSEDRIYTYEYDALNRLTKTTDPLGNESRYTYDKLGNLQSFTDGNGNVTSYQYDAVSRLVKVLDAMGGETAYTYDKENRILSITAPKKDTTTYLYDAIGQLKAVTDAAGNETSYTYDGIGRLLTVTDALNKTTEYAYDKNNNIRSEKDVMGNSHTYSTDAEGNVLENVYPNGEKERYTYDPNGNILTYTDRYGIVTQFTYDSRGRIVKAADTAGNVMTYTYDAAGNILSQSDVLGRTVEYTYDSFGRPVQIKDVDGAVTGYKYDALDRLIQITDAEGKETTYTYDAVGNLVGTKKPKDAEYQYYYDELNRLTKQIDPEGASTVFLYDKNSNLASVEDGNGVTTFYSYDALNRLETYTDGNGGKTVYTYDALSRLTKITTPEGLEETYELDAAGNILSVTNKEGETTSYTYDNLYRLVSKTSPLGAEESYTYDRHDVVTSVVDALGNKTSYIINKNGQVTRKETANGGIYTYAYDEVHRLTAMTTPLGYEMQFAYSLGDDVIRQSDNLGRVTGYTYDVLHRMTSVTDPEGGVTSYEYDESDNLSQMTNALGYRYSYSYDKNDRMILVADPEEKVTSILYDKVGNVTSITMPGERTTSYSYDGNYNLVGVTDPMGYQYQYSYDQDDRIIGTVNPLGETTSYIYDKANRLVSYTDRRNLTEKYVYDAQGNVTEYTDTAGLVTRYTYDLKNRLTDITDAQGSSAHYTYDVMDNLISVTDYLGRGTSYTYDIEGNLTGITDAAGRTETMTYDIASRIVSYTTNGGNRIAYDYDKLDDLIQKSYTDSDGNRSAEAVTYAYDSLGQRVAMYDSTGNTEYTYDGLGRLTEVTTYRTNTGDGSVNTDPEYADVVRYAYDEAGELCSITYPDSTQVTYTYDKNGNMQSVTDREGQTTTYVYDALNRITEIHRPNGISTYNAYDAADHIVELTNICDACEWVVSTYSYTYDARGFIVSETAVESLAGYAYDDKHNGKHTDGRHDDLYPHGTKHAKHDKDAVFAYQIVETDRTFTYDDAGKLLSCTETEDNYGTYVYTYGYDAMGNRTAMTKTAGDGTVAEWHKYEYNESNQLVSEQLYDGKKTTSLAYTYDADGNRITETGKIGTEKVEKTYEYTVENRLAAVYDGEELLMAAAYDGDGNRVFQLNYNLHTDEDWKDNSGNGNGSNKDNKGNGNGKGNTTNAQENDSQNQSGILFPLEDETGSTEEYLIGLIKTSGKEKNYELIEYINDVNREFSEVLVEQNINGDLDTAYVYGSASSASDRLSLDRFDGSSGYYLYDPKENVTGITNEEGQIYQSYRYDSFGEITFGAPWYENEYTYNGESYNPNIESQYLRARYYNVVSADFLTEDSYLGDITQPLTLNRYNYCVSNPVNYSDPSGNYTYAQGRQAHEILQNEFINEYKNSGCGMKAYKEYPVYHYPYSATGKGRIDMVLETPVGLEVYEIKPLWQYTYEEGQLPFMPGVKQRDGYIKSLRNEKKKVSQGIYHFDPNGRTFDFEDPYYDTITYYTTGQEGMIYYRLSKKNKVPQKQLYYEAIIEEAKEKAYTYNCLDSFGLDYGIYPQGTWNNYWGNNSMVPNYGMNPSFNNQYRSTLTMGEEMTIIEIILLFLLSFA